MSTTPIETWAVDLADVTVIYPGVGYEGIMVVVAVALWLAWHVWQVKHENATYEDEKRKYGTAEHKDRAISGD